MEKKVVCFRRAKDGRSIVLMTDQIGGPNVAKKKLIASANDWGFFSTKIPDASGCVVMLSPKPLLTGFGGMQIVSNGDSVSIVASVGQLPSIAESIIKGAYCCARECDLLPVIH